MSREIIDRFDANTPSPKPAQQPNNYALLNDIFTDSADIHNSANRDHSQGPVLLELDLEIIRNTYTGKVWISKSNPMTWESNLSHDRKWFVSANDLEDNFSCGSFNHMVVFRHCGGKLPIQGYLNRIILDDPKLQTDEDNIDYFSMAYGALKLAMREGGFDIPIVRRDCNQGCGCTSNYRQGTTNLDAMFSL
ncbi:MAG: hypothetical protein ABW098_12815 [Candidatus Thiodiazotropha sp.]